MHNLALPLLSPIYCILLLLATGLEVESKFLPIVSKNNFITVRVIDRLLDFIVAFGKVFGANEYLAAASRLCST